MEKRNSVIPIPVMDLSPTEKVINWLKSCKGFSVPDELPRGKRPAPAAAGRKENVAPPISRGRL